MPVSYIEFKGKKILHVNLNGITDKSIVLENLELMVKFYKEADHQILLLLDVRGTFVNSDVMDKLKHYGKTVFNGRSAKRTVLGVTGMKKILLKAYNVFTSTEVAPFETEEEAKEYLAS